MNIKDWYRRVWYWSCRYILIAVPAHTFFKLVFLINCWRLGFRWYSFSSQKPETLNEKINFIKLHYRSDLCQTIADKVAVREYVEKVIGSEYLIPALGVFNNTGEIDFDMLPDQFALKTNHGSGWNLICKDKHKLNWPKEQKKIDRWLQWNAFYLSREWQYRGIKSLLICEELLEYEIKDFKVFCYHGVAKFVQVDMNRYTDKGRTRDLYDRAWKKLDVQLNYPKSEIDVEQPECLSEMLTISEKLARPFEFCRIDLYQHKGKIYFGEVTMYPGGGVEPFATIEQDRYMGSFLDLNRLDIPG